MSLFPKEVHWNRSGLLKKAVSCLSASKCQWDLSYKLFGFKKRGGGREGERKKIRHPFHSSTKSLKLTELILIS